MKKKFEIEVEYEIIKNYDFRIETVELSLLKYALKLKELGYISNCKVEVKEIEV